MNTSPKTKDKKRTKPVSPLPVEQWTLAWPGVLANFAINSGIFGGSILFSIIISTVPPTSPYSPFSVDSVRLFLAAAWMCWVMVMAIGALIVLLYTDEMLTLLFRGRWFTRDAKKLELVEMLISLLVLAATYVLVLSLSAAWILMGLAMVAYISWVGWVVVAGASLITLIAIVLYAIFGLSLLYALRSKRPSRITHVFIINEEDRRGMTESRDWRVGAHHGATEC